MTATEKLLPCPFCGGEASVQTTYAHGVSEAFCLDCGAHTGYPPDGCTEAEAVAAWNTRSDYAVQAANERKAEQAIEATLGRGTCRLESMHGYTDPYVATRYVVELSCHTLDDWPESEPPAYCPWCGAKVVADASVD